MSAVVSFVASMRGAAIGGTGAWTREERRRFKRDERTSEE